jgi:hypothetical protein
MGKDIFNLPVGAREDMLTLVEYVGKAIWWEHSAAAAYVTFDVHANLILMQYMMHFHQKNRIHDCQSNHTSQKIIS